MNKFNSKTIEAIKLVAHALGDLNEKSVFVGGATVPLYIPEEYWAVSRVTDDVDVVMEVLKPSMHWKMEEQLRQRGFRNDTRDGAPICRWIYQGLSVDIVGADSRPFGFTNFWYKEGIERSVEINLSSVKIRILSTPYFIASKLEAFKSRGRKDFMSSSDMEDIISVLEVGSSDKFLMELRAASNELKKYLVKDFKILLINSDFLDALPGAVFSRHNPDEGIQAVMDKIDFVIQAHS